MSIKDLTNFTTGYQAKVTPLTWPHWIPQLIFHTSWSTTQ